MPPVDHDRFARGGWLALLSLVLGFVASCARVADPQPPLVEIPRRIESLEVRQLGQQIRLHMNLPTHNQDGSEIRRFQAITIYKMSVPRSEPASSSSASFSKSDAKLLAALSERDAERLRPGSPFVFTDPEPADSDEPPHSRRWIYAVELPGRRGQSDGLSPLASLEPQALPEPPSTVRVSIREEGVLLEWDLPQENADGSRPPQWAAFNVYRSLEETPQFTVPLNAQPLGEPRFLDTDMVFGRACSYAVSVLGRRGLPHVESGTSKAVRAEPKDLFPPAVPQRLEAFGVIEAVSLRWDANTETDLAGYYVYRSDTESEPGRRLNENPIIDIGFIDRTADREKSYYYRLTAVDRRGNESRFTTAVPGSPSTP